MRYLQIKQVRHAFGSRDVLKDITLSLQPGTKMALTGDNGSGKTTLLKIIAGLLAPDSGQIVKPKESVISYLPQSGISHSDSTLFEEAEKAFSRFGCLLEEKRQLETDLEHVTENDGGVQSKVDRHHEIEELLIEAGYHRREERIHRILSGIGFLNGDYNRDTSQFSGGWQMRIALAKVLLEQPDALLLDEPTNYLDLEARDWLEEYLLGYSGTLMLVSHDRYFLDATVGTVAELWNGHLTVYTGNFSSYEKKRAAEMESILAAYKKQQEEISKNEEFIRKFRYNASKAALVQSRIAKLEKMEIIEVPESLKRIHFAFPKAPHSGKKVLRVDSLSRSYGDTPALKGVSFEIERGENLVIMGTNGAGKSTLMRILAGKDTHYSGEIRYGTDVEYGYFSQDNNELEERATVYDEAENSCPLDLIPKLRNILGAFLFRGDDIYKRVSVLSGGERSRLALLKLLLHPKNLLILDEPTNHLDMASTDVLAEALKRFDGTVIFVSHDRHFIKGVATRVLELEAGAAKNYPGDFSYYLWRKQHEQESSGEPEENDAAKEKSSQRDHQKRKKAKSALQKLTKDEQTIIEKIESLDTHKQELIEELARPEVYSDGERVKSIQEQLAKVERQQGVLSTEWSRIEQELNMLSDAVID
jgi:ATP-binding cassette subfamily F protein 3